MFHCVEKRQHIIFELFYIVEFTDRVNDEVCQPHQPSCISSPDGCAVRNRSVLHGLVLCVSFALKNVYTLTNYVDSNGY